MKIKVCDFCEKILDKTYIDGKVRMGGWATMCDDCFKTYGVGLGLGCGQRFDVQTGKKLEG